MMAPGLFMIALLFYAPMVGIILAFKDFNPVDGIFKSPWMDPWYKNFEFFFKSDTVKTVTLPNLDQLFDIHFLFPSCQ